MALEPKQLTHLAAIAKHGSFSRAAQFLNLSQPALSASIARLEKFVGASVLERGRQGAKLTELGRTLVRHAHALQAQLARATDEVRLKKLGGDGPLSIGVTPVSAADLVPQALGRLKAETADISVSVVEGVLDEAMTALHSGEVDLVVGPIGVYASSKEIVEERLIQDPLGVVMNSAHALSMRRSCSLHQLREAEWALPSEHSAFRRQLEALFITAGVQWPTFYLATNSMTALKAIVAHSNCVTIMPKRLVALECQVGSLVHIDLRDRGRHRSLGIIRLRHRSLSPLAARFVEILRVVSGPA
jgi:molybdate transport repressor ModE-like protein